MDRSSASAQKQQSKRPAQRTATEELAEIGDPLHAVLREHIVWHKRVPGEYVHVEALRAAVAVIPRIGAQ